MSEKAVKFYVAVDGSDSWSGRIASPAPDRTDGPFATPARARDAVRQLKAAEGLTRPVRVMIAAGTYTLAEPLVLGPEDSGTETCPVTYAAYGRGRPVISGGRRITGWRREDDATWTAELPDVRAGTWYFHQLFVNGRRRGRPRFPERGNLSLAPADPEDEDAPENLNSFRFASGDIRGDWRNLDDVEVVILQYWMEARLRIESLDAGRNIVSFTGSSWRPLSWTFGYYVENVAEELKRPGQWYLDRGAGVLTYLPAPREKMEKAEVVAPALDHLLQLAGDPDAGRFVQHVNFRGLSFQHAAWIWPREGHAITQAEIDAPAAVRAAAALHCSFENCEFARLGGWAIELGRGCRKNRVKGCRFHDIGSGGVKVGEAVNPERQADEASGNIISDNDLREGALIYLGAAAIWLGHAGGNVVAHNEIQGAFQWAVSVGWSWHYWPPNRAANNVVEYNHVHDVGTGPLGVHAALYALGVQPGTAFRNNLIRDVHGWPGFTAAASGCGIILDNACAGIVVENNLAYRCDGGGFCTNFNVMGNIVQNNIFALGRHAQLNRYGDPAPPGEWMPNPIIFRNNIVYWNGGRLFWDKGWPNFGVLWDYNLYFDTRGGFEFIHYSLDEWRAKGIDTNSVVADPLFGDPAGGDFTLKDDSPAIALGFRPFDLSSVGPRRP